MCTVVILRRPDSDWPLLLAANRDEMANRRCQPPARHWSDYPGAVAGLDELAGGTWLGVNDHGVTAAVLNRLNTLGPLPGSKSRGELPLHALEQTTARAAVASLGTLDANAYRPFNMIVADSRDAFWLRCRQAENSTHMIESGAILQGLSMVTAYDLNDMSSPRIGRFLERFQAAAEPDPGSGEWSQWQAILASREHDADAGPGGAMCVVTDFGFGTVSSSLIALPAKERHGVAPIWLFSLGRPGENAYMPVSL